jgi:Uma2 family endonuclease
MPAVVDRSQLPELDPNSPPRKKWTRKELAFFEGQEPFAGQNYELIRGELIEYLDKKRPHSNVQHAMMMALAAVFDWSRIQQEATIDVAGQENIHNAPEPDLIVINRRYSDIQERFPGPSDIVLVVEIADTTLSFDLRTKAPLYARAGFPEYWVLDSRALIAHRDPRDGEYQSIVRYTEFESVAPLAAGGRELAISAVFPSGG